MWVTPVWGSPVTALIVYAVATSRGKGALLSHGGTVAVAIAAVGSIGMAIVRLWLR